MHRFKLGEQIGDGHFGEVRKARVRSTGYPVALKIIPITRLGEGIPHPIVREAIIAPRMIHQNLVRTFEVFTEGTSMVLVMERCSATVVSLLAEHSVRNPLPKCIAKKLAYSLLSAVAYMHEMDVLHRDIKPSNCMLTADLTLKLGDFGVSRVFTKNADLSHEVGTRWYRAPEALLGQRRYGESIDIWAVGSVVAELIRGFGGALFCGDGDLCLLGLIFDALGTPDTLNCQQSMPDWEKIQFESKQGKGVSYLLPMATPTECDFLEKMLCVDPSKRRRAVELLEHPFFTCDL